MNRIKNAGIAIFILQMLLLSVFGCETTSVTSEQGIKINVEDIASTETWIKITTENLSLPLDATLQIDTSYINMRIVSTDTLLFIDSLQPNKNYKLQLIINEKLWSEASFKTMDTTSNDFTWEIYEFADHTDGEFYDCAILAPDDIWCVGEFYMNDSLGNQDPHRYTAVHWNGQNWEIKRVYYPEICGGLNYPPLKSIWELPEHEYVLTSGGSVGWCHEDDILVDCDLNPLLNGGIRKMWGDSKNDFYAVGTNGLILHYNGSIWEKLDSHTNADITDIWGITDQNGQKKIYCSVSSYDVSRPDKKILVISPGNKISECDHPQGSIQSVWTDNGRFLFIAGSGIYNNKSGIWVSEPSLHQTATYKIKGNGRNDLFTCGSYGKLAHYNGKRWHRFQEIKNRIPNANILSVTQKGDLVVAVGFNFDRGLIIAGKRN